MGNLKFQKVYCYGGNARDGEDDFITEYRCENGKRIIVKFLISNQSFRSYVVDGKGYTSFKAALAACAKE